MSLFIGLLAFPDEPALQDSVKIGILAGSLVAALAGAAVLLLSPPPGPEPDEDDVADSAYAERLRSFASSG